MSEQREHTGNSGLESGPTVRIGALREASVARYANNGGTRRAARTRARKPTRARYIVLASIAVHLIAASALYSHLVGQLYKFLEDTPRLVVLERGLVRLLAVSVFLPPVAPTLLLIATTLWIGSRRGPKSAMLLAWGSAALAGDSVLRLLGVWLARPVANVGELLDLPARFSPGPRMFAALAGHELAGGGLVYWSVVCSIAAMAVIYCVARALLEAERSQMDPVEQRRLSMRGDAIAALQFASVSIVAFLAIAFLGQLALPPATQVFLQTFG
jgi:hypothetical protein